MRKKGRKKRENSKVTIHCVHSVNLLIFNLGHNSMLVLLQHCVVLIELYKKKPHGTPRGGITISR